MPTISGYDGVTKLLKNSSLVLTCESCGGSPMSTLHWFLEGEYLLHNNTLNSQIGDCSVSCLQFNDLTEVYHRDRLYCVAENGFLANKSVTIQVQLESNGKLNILSKL